MQSHFGFISKHCLCCLPARMKPHWELGSSPSPLGCPVSRWALGNTQLTVNSSLKKRNQRQLTLWKKGVKVLDIDLNEVCDNTPSNGKLAVFFCSRCHVNCIPVYSQWENWSGCSTMSEMLAFSLSLSLSNKHTHTHTHLFLESVFTILKPVSIFGHVYCSFPVPAFYTHINTHFSFTLHLLPSLIYFHPWVAQYLLIPSFPAHTPLLPLTQPWLTLANVCVVARGNYTGQEANGCSANLSQIAGNITMQNVTKKKKNVELLWW